MTQTSVTAFDQATSRDIDQEVARLEPLFTGFRRCHLEKSWPSPTQVDLDDLRAMAGLQNLFFDHAFTSHRPVVGPIIVLAKRIAVTICNRILKISLVRQVELNQHLWNLALTVRHLEQRVRELERAVEEKRP